jgi:hypothetical protein
MLPVLFIAIVEKDTSKSERAMKQKSKKAKKQKSNEQKSKKANFCSKKVGVKKSSRGTLGNLKFEI